jgi:PAS domain S-box-containing protein
MSKTRDQYGRFDSKPKLKKDSYNQYRLYYLIASVVSPIFSFLIFDEKSDIKNFYTDISIPVIFFSIGILSFYNQFIKNNLKYIFFFYCLFLTFYSYIIYADSGYTIHNFLGYMIVFFAITIGINDYKLSFIFSAFNILLIIISHFIWIDAIEPVGILTEVASFGIIALVGFIIHYNSYLSLKAILYNEGLLSNILDSTADGMLLMNENNTIIDSNKKVHNLFKINDANYFNNKKWDDLTGKDIEPGNNKIVFKTADQSFFIADCRVNIIDYQGKKYTIVALTDVTESIERNKELDIVKQQLIESEKTYRELFDNSYDLFFVVDEGLNIIDVNKQVLRISGKEDEEFMNKNMHLFLNDSDFTVFTNWLHSNLQLNIARTFNLFGSSYDFTVRKTSYYDITHFIITARSAENRIKYENVLRDSRDQMLMILESINSIIYFEQTEKDGSSKLRYLSNKVKEILGISIDEFITLRKSERMYELIHPEDRELVRNKKNLLLEQHVSVEITYRILVRENYIWLQERIYPKFDNSGNHIANFGIATDVTADESNKQALEAANRKNRDFIERNLAGFYRIDIHKKILDCNDSFARIFGFDAAINLIGKSVNEIYVDSTDRNSFISNLILNTSVKNNESKITLINKKVIWVLENATLIKNENGDEFIESTMFDITDLKMAEIALEKSEETLSMILHNIDDFIYNVEFNPDGSRFFNYLGDQVERITGLSKEDYIKKVTERSVTDLIHPDDLPNVLLAAEEMKDKKSVTVFQYRFLQNQTKKYIWVEEKVFPHFSKEGNIIRIFGVVSEITEKKLAEQSIIDSEEKYRNLFEKNMAGVFQTTTDCRMVDCNEAFMHIFGYSSKEEIMRISSKDLYFSNEDREKYIRELRKNKNLYNYELLHRRKDNSRAWVLANVSLTYDEKRNEEFIVGSLSDITELKKANEALAENEEKFRLLFDATNDAILILDEEKISDCNERSIDTFGCTADQMNRKLCDGIHIADLSPKFQPDGTPSTEKIKLKIKDVLNGNSQMFYWRFNRIDGAPFDAEVSLNQFSLNNKIFVQAIIRDITARLKAEMALRESEDRFKMLSNATIEGIIFTDNGVIIDSNDQFAFMYGFESRKQIIGKNIDDFLYDQSDIDKVNKIIAASSEEKFEVKSKRKDGTLVWVESKGKFLPYYGRKLRVSVVYDITDRKLKEQEIQDSRESFMNLTELSPNGSIIHTDGIIQYANPTVLKFLGFDSAGEIIGKNILDYLSPEQRIKSSERIERIKNGDNVGYTEFSVKTKDGNQVEIAVQSVKIMYNGKEAIHVIVSDLSQQKELQKEKLRAQLAEETNLLLEKEIQERKETEQRLWETQMFTTNMFNSSLDMIMASDRNNFITQINNAVVKTFGYESNEIIGMHPQKLYASEEEFELVRRGLLEKGNFTGEIKNLRKNGEEFISYLSATVLRNTQGKIIGTMGISRDITETLKSQRKIREQDAKIRSIFDNAANMLIWTIDRQYKLRSFNTNFKEVMEKNFNVYPKLGMNLKELIKSMIHPDDFSITIKGFEKSFKGENTETEASFKSINNSVIWMETFINPIFLEDGSIEEISCISHEITEKKQTESQIRQSLKEKEVLLKEVHHRVKNNLQVISSILNLQSSYVKDDQTLSILRESQNRIKSMSFIHESLYQTKNFSSINFSDYIINLSNNLFHSYQIFDNFIDLKLDIQPVNLNLDQAIPCGLIVNELITNALKYAFKGRKRGIIFIGITEEGKTVSVRIEDNGVGLPKGFDYLKSETLGLQLVVTLVEQLDGKLELKSDKGTKFLITFDKLN